MEKENNGLNFEIFAPNESDFAKELMKKLGYTSEPQITLGQISKSVEAKIDWNNLESTTDVISLYIPPSKEAEVVGQVIFLNKMDNPQSPFKVGLYFRSPNLFEGQVCKADTSAGIRFFKYFAIDLLEHGAKAAFQKWLVKIFV